MTEQHTPTSVERTDRWIKVRIIVFGVAIAIIFGLVFVRAYRLQIDDGARLRAMAEQQYRKTIEIAPPRGAIFDRNGTPLALSVDVDSVYANPRVIGNQRSNVARSVAKILHIPRMKLERALRSKRYFVWLKRRVTPQVAQKIREAKLTGIGLTKESKRFYPNSELAATVLGFAGMDGTGLEGVERSLNKWLRDAPVRVDAYRDALGRSVVVEALGESVGEAKDVRLTIDRYIQFETEKAVREANAVTNPQRGWVAAVVMEPQSGDILAMASAPGFDPNHFGKAKPRHRRNRAITDAFEPGSTAKVFSVAAALEQGTVRPEEVIDCEEGRFRVGRHIIHDTKPHGPMSIAEILAKSSNIGVSKIAFRLGRNQLFNQLKRFGFASRTGLILPGERTGVLRDPKRWSKVGLANIAFGQGLTVTVLQLARALSAIGNGGLLVQPNLVAEISDRDGKKLPTQKRAPERVLRQSTAETVLRLMTGVAEHGGTATEAALSRYTVAGKTGTAQKVDPKTGAYSSHLWLSSFMGLVPASRPRLAIVVVVNEPEGKKYYGGQVAGPVFKHIAEKSLRYLGVRPDRLPETSSASQAVAQTTTQRSRKSADKATAPPLPESGHEGPSVRIPDFTGMGMQKVLAAARKTGIEVRLEGSGVATAQSPGPGPAPIGTICRVAMRPPG